MSNLRHIDRLSMTLKQLELEQEQEPLPGRKKNLKWRILQTRRELLQLYYDPVDGLALCPDKVRRRFASLWLSRHFSPTLLCSEPATAAGVLGKRGREEWDMEAWASDERVKRLQQRHAAQQAGQKLEPRFKERLEHAETQSAWAHCVELMLQIMFVELVLTPVPERHADLGMEVRVKDRAKLRRVLEEWFRPDNASACARKVFTRFGLRGDWDSALVPEDVE